MSASDTQTAALFIDKIPSGQIWGTDDPYVGENSRSYDLLLSRSGPTDEPLVVSLSSSDGTELSVPNSVTIPAGQSTITFTVYPIDDAEIDGDQYPIIFAQADGVTPASRTVRLIDTTEPPQPDPTDGIVSGTDGIDIVEPGFVDADGDIYNGSRATVRTGAGADVIVNQNGSGNSFNSGGGDDTITLGGGNTAYGGDDDDLFIIDPTSNNTETIIIKGGADSISNAYGSNDRSDLTNGNDGDILDLRGLEHLQVIDGPDPGEGTAVFLNEDWETVVIRYTGIEHVLTGDRPLPEANGVVDGTEGNDRIVPGYEDESGEGVTDGDDTIEAGAGNDTIDGGLGNDTIFGGDGNDLISDTEGHNDIDGGAGIDTLYLDAVAEDFTFEFDDNHDIILVHKDGYSHALNNVEYIQLPSEGRFSIEEVIAYARAQLGDTEPVATEGDDLLELPQGGGVLDGLGGHDTLQLSGNVEDYGLGFDSSDNLVVIAPDGSQTHLVNVDAVEIGSNTYGIEDVVHYAESIGAPTIGVTLSEPIYGSAEADLAVG